MMMVVSGLNLTITILLFYFCSVCVCVCVCVCAHALFGGSEVEPGVTEFTHQSCVKLRSQQAEQLQVRSASAAPELPADEAAGRLQLRPSSQHEQNSGAVV